MKIMASSESPPSPTDSKLPAKSDAYEELTDAPSDRKMAKRVSVLSEASTVASDRTAEEQEAPAPSRKKKRKRKKEGKPGLQERWDEMFHRLVEYKRVNGHCLVPNRYAEDPSLGAWVSTQRRQYKILTSGSSESTPMTPERASRLMSIGFVWATKDPRHVPWEKRFRELCEFKEKYGHCLVPIGYQNNVQLSNWVSTQRQEYKLMREGRTSRMTPERIQALEGIGFVWEAQRGGPRRKNRGINDDDTPSGENNMASLPSGDLHPIPGSSPARASAPFAAASAAGGPRPPFLGPPRERTMVAGMATAAGADQEAAMAAQLHFAAGARAAEQAMMLRALSQEQALMRGQQQMLVAPAGPAAWQPVVVPVAVPFASTSMILPPGYAAAGMPDQAAALWQQEQEALRRLMPSTRPSGYLPSGRYPPHAIEGRISYPHRRSSNSSLDGRLVEEAALKRRRLGDSILNARGRGSHNQQGGQNGGFPPGRRRSSEISTSLIRQVAAQLGEEQNEIVENSKLHNKPSRAKSPPNSKEKTPLTPQPKKRTAAEPSARDASDEERSI